MGLGASNGEKKHRLADPNRIAFQENSYMRRETKKFKTKQKKKRKQQSWANYEYTVIALLFKNIVTNYEPAQY